jgi:hypothetical protein
MKIKNKNTKREKHSFKQNFITMKYENMKRIELWWKIILQIDVEHTKSNKGNYHYYTHLWTYFKENISRNLIRHHPNYNTNENWMNFIHALLQFMVFSIRFSSKKIAKSDMHKKTTLSIWTSCFGHVLHD